MTIFESTFDYKPFYNKFIKKYNDSKDKSNAISEIKTQRDLLSDKEKRDEKTVSDHLNKLKTIAKLPIFPVNPGDNELNSLNMKALKKVLDDFKDKIKNERHIDFSEYLLPILKTAIEKSFPSETIGHYPATKCIKKAEAICSLGESIKRCREKQMHLNRIIDQAINDDYPDTLAEMGPQSTDEREKLQGAAKSKKEQKETAQAKHYPEIIKAADKVIGNKKLSDFVTNSGNANSSLYSGILRYHDEVPEPTLRRWLNKDLKSGDFEKMLTEYRQKLQQKQRIDPS